MPTKLVIAVAFSVCTLTAANLRAEFVLTTSEATLKVYNGDAIKDQTSILAHVGSQSSTDTVLITTNVGVDSGAGYATIKAADKDADLTTITFTPTDGNLFDAFSFSGILNDSANGTVLVTVQDNQGNAPQTFTVTGLGNGNFGSVGIVAVAGSGETIKSVTLTSSFSQEKQNNFSFASAQPVPAPPAFVLLGLGGLSLGAFVRRRKQTDA